MTKSKSDKKKNIFTRQSVNKPLCMNIHRKWNSFEHVNRNVPRVMEHILIKEYCFKSVILLFYIKTMFYVKTCINFRTIQSMQTNIEVAEFNKLV